MADRDQCGPRALSVRESGPWRGRRHHPPPRSRAGGWCCRVRPERRRCLRQSSGARGGGHAVAAVGPPHRTDVTAPPPWVPGSEGDGVRAPHRLGASLAAPPRIGAGRPLASHRRQTTDPRPSKRPRQAIHVVGPSSGRRRHGEVCRRRLAFCCAARHDAAPDGSPECGVDGAYRPGIRRHGRRPEHGRRVRSPASFMDVTLRRRSTRGQGRASSRRSGHRPRADRETTHPTRAQRRAAEAV
jgi:hypothetical protein